MTNAEWVCMTMVVTEKEITQLRCHAITKRESKERGREPEKSL